MSWPLLDDVARAHLAGASLLGRTVHLDLATDEATSPVTALLAAAGALVVGDPAAELVVRHHEVRRGEVVADLPALDPTGDAHATIRAVLRLTNRRLPGTRVAVVGFDPGRRELARALRALGARVVVVDDDPLHRLAALTDGHDLGTVGEAAIVLADDAAGLGDLADGAVVAGRHPASVGAVVDEPRSGVHRVRRAGLDLYVLDPGVLAGGRAPATLDLVWTTRLVALAWLAAAVLPPGRHALPAEQAREIAAAALVARGVPA